MSQPAPGGEVSVTTWLALCLGRDDTTMRSASQIGQGKSSRVWDCSLDIPGMGAADYVLKMYEPNCRDYVGLSPERLARKHALALRELSGHGIPVPRLLGCAAEGPGAALVTEKVAATAWSCDTRLEAGRVLARLHAVDLDSLGAELAALVTASPPNRGRILNGVRGMAEHLDAKGSGWRKDHPWLSELVDTVADGELSAEGQVLVHRDYFSANILATPTGVCVVDWDLLSRGDPMWDLGFLVGADRNVTDSEAAAVIAAYGESQPVPEGRLRWNRDCWEAFWRLRELCDGPDGRSNGSVVTAI